MRSKTVETRIISHAHEIRKSNCCQGKNFSRIYGITEIKAKNDHQNKFKFDETLDK